MVKEPPSGQKSPEIHSLKRAVLLPASGPQAAEEFGFEKSFT